LASKPEWVQNVPDTVNAGQRRIIWKTAYILHGDMNVAVGPHKEHMEESFQQQMQKQTTHQTDKDPMLGVLKWQMLTVVNLDIPRPP